MAEKKAQPPTRPPPPSYLQNGATDMEQTDDHHRITQIKQYHDEAYLYIEQALTCDEQRQTEQTLALYLKGIDCINSAIDLFYGGLQENTPEGQKAKNLVTKMHRTKHQIQARIEGLSNQDSGAAMAMDPDPPPSYDAAMTPSDSPSDLDLLFEAVAEELFQISDGVQIFYITSEGSVSAPSYPSSLGIYKFRDDSPGCSSGGEIPQVFLRVGDWTYPLLPGKSPVLHANWGAYIFPDINSENEGNAVGVIIPDYVNPATRAKFESMLQTYTDMRNQEGSPSVEERGLVSRPLPSVARLPGEESEQPSLAEERTSTKISRGIETAAVWISWGLMKGAEKTGELMKKGSIKIREQIKPEEVERKMDPRARQGVYYTRKATEGIVQVSGYLVNKLGQGTMFLARKAAPHLKKTGEKYLPDSFVSKDGSGQSTMDSVLEVAAGGVKGWATVYVGLEQSAKVLATNIADETVTVVSHKYGKDAGQLTEDAMYSGANVALTVHHASNMGATAIAKRAAKDTGKALVEDGNKISKMDYGDKSTELRDS